MSASPAPFRTVASERPFRGQLLTVRLDRIADQEGVEAAREVVEHPGAVAALVVDEAGRVLLVEQWRHAVGGRTVEIAAGKYDVDGEAVTAALRRELAEELHVEGGTLTWLASFWTTPGWSDETVDLFLVEGARPLGERAPEGDWEEAGMEVLALDYGEALRLATSGAVGDSKTLVALTLYGLFRAGLWEPDPSSAPVPDAPKRRAARRPR